MKRNGKQPVVSVIVPTYNAGEFVAQCLDSVLGQTMGDFELICVDDGSTDDTWAIVEERAQRDGRVAALRQANAGPGAARNAGLERACGRYVYCLDADDYLECDMLASCVKALDDAQADMALVAFRTYNQRAGRTYPAEWGMRHEDAFPSYPAGSFTWETAPELFFETVQNVPWNKVVRRSLLEERGIRFQELRLTEDLMYSLPAAVASGMPGAAPGAPGTAATGSSMPNCVAMACNAASWLFTRWARPGRPPAAAVALLKSSICPFTALIS